MKNKDKQQYIIRKYIMATSAKDAIRRDKDSEVNDVWVDQDWVKTQHEDKNPAIGFAVETENDE